MKSSGIIFIFISAFLTSIVFFATNSIPVSIGIFAISILYFFTFGYMRIKKASIKSKRYHAAFQFINNFIIALSVKKTVGLALESTSDTFDEELRREIVSVEHLDDMEKLEYLEKYFHFDVYKLFLSIVSLYVEQGGNILDMSSNLLSEIRLDEEYINEVNSYARGKIFEFGLLWSISLSILIIIRVVLSQFYESFTSMLFYQLAVGGICLFVLLTIDICIRHLTSLDIRGWKHEKI